MKCSNKRINGYASIAPTVSVSALFIGGIVPGMLIGMAFLLVVVVRARSFPVIEDVQEEEEQSVLRTILAALPALAAPGIILYSVFGGVATVFRCAGTG